MKRKNKVYFFIALSLLFLSGCSSSVTSKQWDELEEGMTVESVKKLLGSPKKDVINKRELLDVINKNLENSNSLYSSAKNLNGFDDEKNTMEQSIELIEQIHDSVEQGKDIRIYIYKVKTNDGDAERSIYFYKNKVLYFNGQKFDYSYDDENSNDKTEYSSEEQTTIDDLELELQDAIEDSLKTAYGDYALINFNSDTQTFQILMTEGNELYDGIYKISEDLSNPSYTDTLNELANSLADVSKHTYEKTGKDYKYGLVNPVTGYSYIFVVQNGNVIEKAY